MTPKMAACLAVAILLAAITHAFSSRYELGHGGKAAPVKLDRWTGRSWWLSNSGWRDIPQTPGSGLNASSP